MREKERRRRAHQDHILHTWSIRDPEHVCLDSAVRAGTRSAELPGPQPWQEVARETDEKRPRSHN